MSATKSLPRRSAVRLYRPLPAVTPSMLWAVMCPTKILGWFPTPADAELEIDFLSNGPCRGVALWVNGPWPMLWADSDPAEPWINLQHGKLA